MWSLWPYLPPSSSSGFTPFFTMDLHRGGKRLLPGIVEGDQIFVKEPGIVFGAWRERMVGVDVVGPLHRTLFDVHDAIPDLLNAVVSIHQALRGEGDHLCPGVG